MKRCFVPTGNCSEKDSLFRILFFRLLNKPETWVNLTNAVGEISLDTFSFEYYSEKLEALREQGPIYGNAFILCANKAYGFDRKHENHLALLEEIFVKSAAWERLLGVGSLRELVEELRLFPLLGDFMAYQIATDLCYSPLFPFDENDFTVPGPGAKRGMAKCFIECGANSPAEVILWMVKTQQEWFDYYGLTFEQIGNRSLHAIDCQGLFCEVDKYSRVRFPELQSNRVRIKSEFSASSRKIEYFFPPKWRIGEFG